MEQIILKKNKKETNDILKGKTIKDISFSIDFKNEEPFLILTFTDETYIYLGIEYDYIFSSSDYKIHQFANKHVVPFKCYVNIPGWINNGKVEFYQSIEEEIRTGILKEPNREMCLKAIKEKEAKDREWRYQEYLKLKEEFENEDKN